MHPLTKLRRGPASAVLIGAGLRAAALAVAGGLRPVGDEDSYLGAARALVETGTQDTFWPPLTPWLAATLLALVGRHWFLLRAAFACLDLTNVFLVHRLARNVCVEDAADSRSDRVPTFAALIYATYIPAIGFATTVTSEVPAVFLVLLAACRLTDHARSSTTPWLVGVCFGLATLARSNLLLLGPIVAASVFAGSARNRTAWRELLIVALVSLLLPFSWLVRNGACGEGYVISRNAAFNLYVGNIPDFQEDLNLFHPAATPAQRAARNTGVRPELDVAARLSDAEMTREAIGFIRRDPILFARRALGRLARVFAPKTAQLTLIGGEQAGGLHGTPGRALLGGALLQWAFVLFGGVFGLAGLLARTERSSAIVLVSIVLGALPLCLVAIAKPRYAFPFEPVLVVAAAWLVENRSRVRRFTKRTRVVVSLVSLFLVWGWVAWFVFAFTSRA